MNYNFIISNTIKTKPQITIENVGQGQRKN